MKLGPRLQPVQGTKHTSIHSVHLRRALVGVFRPLGNLNGLQVFDGALLINCHCASFLVNNNMLASEHNVISCFRTNLVVLFQFFKELSIKDIITCEQQVIHM